MRLLPSSVKTARRFRLLAFILLVFQVFELWSIWTGNVELNPSARRGLAQTCVAIGVGYIFVYVRKYYPRRSQEAFTLLLIGLGIGVLAFDELGKSDLLYTTVRVVAKLAASALFLTAVISDPLRFLPGSDEQTTQDTNGGQFKNNDYRPIFYPTTAFVCAFATGFLPILKINILNSNVYPFEGWVEVIWFSSLISIAFLSSLLYPQWAWRWGGAVSLGLPAAVVVKIILENIGGSTHQSNQYVIFLVASASIVFGVLPSLAGTFCGWLMRKTLDNWGKYG